MTKLSGFQILTVPVDTLYKNEQYKSHTMGNAKLLNNNTVITFFYLKSYITNYQIQSPKLRVGRQNFTEM